MEQQRRILRQRDAARYIALAESTLEKLRGTGGGPPFVRLGARAIGYDIVDLDLWIEAQKRNNTSEELGERKTSAGAKA